MSYILVDFNNVLSTNKKAEACTEYSKQVYYLHIRLFMRISLNSHCGIAYKGIRSFGGYINASVKRYELFIVISTLFSLLRFSKSTVLSIVVFPSSAASFMVSGNLICFDSGIKYDIHATNKIGKLNISMGIGLDSVVVCVINTKICEMLNNDPIACPLRFVAYSSAVIKYIKANTTPEKHSTIKVKQATIPLEYLGINAKTVQKIPRINCE